MTSPADADLLHRYLSDRDESAFAAIVRKHGPMVFAACQRITAHHHDAEDAFQAAFLVLAARAEAVRPRERLGAWLHGVAVRCARKARDSARRTRPAETAVEPAVLPFAIEPDLPHLIDDALAAIPDSYRAAVVLCHLEGRSRGEAARELGWSEGTLSGRLHRALELLARRLTARGVTTSGAALLAVLSVRAASASVPTALAVSTSSAASLLSAGFTEPAGPAASLAAGVVRAMSFRKLKLAAAVLIGAFGVGSFAVLNQAEAKPTGERVVRKNAPVPKEEAKQKWEQLHTIRHDAAITALATREELFVAGDDDGMVNVWDGGTGKLVHAVYPNPTVNPSRVRAVAFAPDGQSVRIINNNGADHLGYAFKPRPRMTWWQQGKVGNGVWLQSGTQDQHGLLLHGANLAVANSFTEDPDRKPITHATLSADDKRFAFVNEDHVLRIRAREERHTDLHKLTLKPSGELTALKLSDDGQRLAVVGENGFARVFDAEAGKELCELKGHDGTVNAVAFTPDGSQVATASGKVVRVFDAKSGKLLGEIKGHDDAVTCLAFAADGKRLVTGSKDKTAKVWEVK